MICLKAKRACFRLWIVRNSRVCVRLIREYEFIWVCMPYIGAVVPFLEEIVHETSIVIQVLGRSEYP